jgi:hypothetical protein
MQTATCTIGKRKLKTSCNSTKLSQIETRVTAGFLWPLAIACCILRPVCLLQAFIGRWHTMTAFYVVKIAMGILGGFKGILINEGDL